MKARYVTELQLRIGKNKVLCDAYIAPINDQVIIGAGLLNYLLCKIDYGAHSVSINGQEIPVVFQRGADGTNVEVSMVRMVKRVVIPPNTLVRVNCRTSVPLHGDVVFNPKKVHKNLIIPNGLCLHRSSWRKWMFQSRYRFI